MFICCILDYLCFNCTNTGKFIMRKCVWPCAISNLQNRLNWTLTVRHVRAGYTISSKWILCMHWYTSQLECVLVIAIKATCYNASKLIDCIWRKYTVNVCFLLKLNSRDSLVHLDGYSNMVLDVITFQTKDFLCHLSRATKNYNFRTRLEGFVVSPKALTKSPFKLIPSKGNAFLNYICLRGLPC